MEKRILFLDFDGVLFDTLREVYLINRACYKGISYLEEIDKEEYSRFSKYKYLVYNIWMFYYYNPIIFSSDENIEQNYFEALKNRNIKEEENFYNDFIRLRRELTNNHYEYWKNLEVPYDFFFGIKKMFDTGLINPVIASKKNKNAILGRFLTYDFKLNEKNIFGCEILNKYPSKADFMIEYMLNHGFNEALFVDDNENNLIPCANYDNIKTILALWGNSGPNKTGMNEKEALFEIENYFISK